MTCVILWDKSPSKLVILYPSIYHLVPCVTLWDSIPQKLFNLPFYILHCYLRHFVRQSPSKLVLLYSPIYHLLPCVTLWHSLPQKLFNFTLLYTPLLLASLCDTISLNTCFTLPSYIPTTSLRHFVTQISLKTCFYLTASSICVILGICRPQAGR